MDVIAQKNKKSKKIRLITSFLIIMFSIVLLIYTMGNRKITILVIMIITIKIVNIYLLYRKSQIKKV
jgi:hypothetical protein